MNKKDIEGKIDFPINTAVVNNLISKESVEAVERSQEAAKQEAPAPATTEANYINLPKGTRVIITEKRTERMHIVVSKSLRAKIEQQAKKAGLSINELLNEILAEQFN